MSLFSTPNIHIGANLLATALQYEVHHVAHEPPKRKYNNDRKKGGNDTNITVSAFCKQTKELLHSGRNNKRIKRIHKGNNADKGEPINFVFT